MRALARTPTGLTAFEIAPGRDRDREWTMPKPNPHRTRPRRATARAASPARRKISRSELTTDLTPLDEALAIVVENTPRLQVARVNLEDALGCTLAHDLTADRSVPGFANSGMDGFALRATDIANASPTDPVTLTCVGEVVAGPGRPAELKRGVCTKIFTGAPVPPGADAVVPIEDVSIRRDRVTFTSTTSVGRHVRGASDSLAPGQGLADAGTVLGPAALGLLASAGFSKVDVHPKPRVVVISTGDELVEPGRRLAYGQVHDSNGVMISSMALRFGAGSVERLHVDDDPIALGRAVTSVARRADLLVFTGGVSVGERDWVRDVLGHILVWRVAVKPGKPFAYSILDNGTPALGLPGNPGAAACAFAVFGAPVLSIMSGRPAPRRLKARLSHGVKGDLRRLSLVRVSLKRMRDGSLIARASNRQESSVLQSFVGTHGLALVKAGGLAKGRIVDVVPFPEGEAGDYA